MQITKNEINLSKRVRVNICKWYPAGYNLSMYFNINGNWRLMHILGVDKGHMAAFNWTKFKRYMKDWLAHVKAYIASHASLPPLNHYIM